MFSGSSFLSAHTQDVACPKVIKIILFTPSKISFQNKSYKVVVKTHRLFENSLLYCPVDKQETSYQGEFRCFIVWWSAFYQVLVTSLQMFLIMNRFLKKIGGIF